MNERVVWMHEDDGKINFFKIKGAWQIFRGEAKIAWRRATLEMA
jgi:hypothetical protein